MRSMPWRQACALSLWGALILVVGALVGAGPTLGEEPNRAALVVQFADLHTEWRCVEFDANEISGADLLRRSGLAVVFSSSASYGAGVCEIAGDGCSNPGNCFCQCQGAGCAYWSYFAMRDGEWQVQNVGASQRRLHDGDMDAWVWGNGRTPPDAVPFGAICPLPQARPTSPASREPTEPAGATATSPRPATPADATAAATPSSAEATARSTAPSVARADNAPDGGGPAGAANEDGGSGAPVGLIAFGAVAGALVAGAGVLALRRRARG